MNEFKNWDTLIKYNERNGIDWEKNVGRRLDFVFNDEHHFLTIKEVHDRELNKHSRNIVVLFDNGKERKLRAERLSQMNFCKVYPIDTHKFKIGDVVNGLQIKKPFNKKKSECNWSVKMYTVQCLNDGYIFDIAETDLDRNRGCPVCSNKRVVSGINDLATTDPWMVQYLKNKDDAMKHTAKSGKETICKCPVCGREKCMTFEVLHRYGFRCDYCSDKISYPNKLMTAILLQLENEKIIKNYKREYKAEWTQGCFYDHYFMFGNENILIEMDGGFHYRDNTLTKQDVSYAQKRDKMKNELALNNNFKLFRINCNYKTIKTRFDYIVKNIKLSLENILDLSTIDWEYCKDFTSSNLVKEICQFYNNGVSRKEIREKYSFISNATIGNYLNIGNSCGLCHYDYKIKTIS